MRRHALLLIPMLVLGSACSSAGSVTTAAPAPTAPELLFFASGAGVTVYDAQAGRATLTVPGGVLAPDRSAVFATTAQGSQTVLDAYDPATGARRVAATVEGSPQLRVANHDGSLVVFGPPRTDGGSGSGYARGRPTTTLTIAPTDGGPTRSLDVAGNVEPEAFSNDDSNLFVLQYLPADAPVGYQVRRVDLSTGELHNIRTDDSDLDKPMAGRARTQVLSPDGTRLYTLYVVADSTGSGWGHAFVHVLDLVDKEAFCIDLPNPFGMGEGSAYGIAIAPDGTHVYSVDPLHGQVADLDTGTMTIAKSAAIPALPSASIVAAVGVGGRLLLGAGTDLVALEPTSLSIQQRWTLDGPAAAVITTPADHVVYVAVNDASETFRGDDISAGPTSTTPLAGAPGLVAADPVPSVDARGPTQCAC